MPAIPDDSFEALPFTRAATVITLRSVATCPGLGFQPLGRPPIGAALFTVVPHADGYRFHNQAHALRDSALPDTLVDWLEERLPATGAIVTRERDQLVASLRRADPLRHPCVTAFLRYRARRLRVIPDEALRHVPALPPVSMPCLCRSGEDCPRQLPACFLPDPGETEAGLVRMAEASWRRWAEQHAAFAEADHPACEALRAFAARPLATPPASA